MINEYSIRFQNYKQSSMKKEEESHDQKLSSKAHPKNPQKKRSRKEDDKNKASAENEMESNFPNSKEECKDTRHNKNDEVSQEVILDKINLAAILERLNSLEQKL